MKTNVKSSSRDTYRAIHSNGVAVRTTEMIIKCLKRYKKLTRAQIAHYTGLGMHQVSGRVNELIARGVVEDTGKVEKCPLTGYNAVKVHMCKKA